MRSEAPALEMSGLEALYEISLLAAGGRNDPAVVARVAGEHACRLLGVEAAAVFAWNEAAGLLEPIYETPSAIPEPAVRPGQGMVGETFASQRALVVEDYQRYPGALSQSAQRGMRAAVSVPMSVAGRAIGALGVWSYEPRPFSEHEVQLLALFAGQVAPALEAARLYEERQRQERQFRRLHELAVAASGVLDARALGTLTVGVTRDLMGADHAALAWWDADLGGLRSISDEAADPGHIFQDRGTIGQAYARGEPVIVEDYPSWECAAPWAVAAGHRSVASVPLLVQDRPVGSLCVRYTRPRRFSESDLRLLSLIAAQVAPAMDAAHLHSRLARSESELRTLYEAMACGVAVQAADGTVLEVNAAACAMFGVPRERFVGCVPSEALAGYRRMLQDGRDAGQSETPVFMAVQTGRPVRGVILGYVFPDGGVRWFQFDSVPVGDGETGPQRVVTSFIDITAVKTAEAARRENEAKSRFLASMSHELRTPLNSILGFAQLLDQATFGELNSRQRRYVGHIASSGAHLLELVNDILDLSKVAAGQMDFHVSDVDLDAVVGEVVARLRPLAESRSLRVGRTGRGGLIARADRRRVEQVLHNLLSNAIKFTPAKGTVSIDVRRGRCEIEVTVRDSGIGIPADQQERVFQEFTQVDDGRSRRHQGTGLGLPLSKRLVELMGGRMWLVSEPGRGSAFSFTLPAAKTATAPRVNPG